MLKPLGTLSKVLSMKTLVAGAGIFLGASAGLTLIPEEVRSVLLSDPRSFVGTAMAHLSLVGGIVGDWLRSVA